MKYLWSRLEILSALKGLILLKTEESYTLGDRGSKTVFLHDLE